MKIEIISDDFYELDIYRNSDNHINVKLYEFENAKTIFDYRCDTFITGNLIVHLKNAIEAHKKSSNKIITSRWYPKFSNTFLNSTVKYPYIYMSLYRKNSNSYIEFFVYTQKNISYNFKIKMSEIEKELEEK